MSNFSFLDAVANQWGEFQKLAQQAEGQVRLNPRVACFYARYTLERTVGEMYRIDCGLKQPYDSSLNAMIHEPSFKNALSYGLFQKLRVIQKVGNRAAHSDKAIAEQEAVLIISELHHFMYWFAKTYSAQPVLNQIFNSALIPNNVVLNAELAIKSAKKLKAHGEEVRKRDEDAAKKQAELEKNNADLNNELTRLREQIAVTKAANEEKPDTHDYNEAQTRKYLIDEYLREVGWDLSKAEQVGDFHEAAKKAGVSFETEVAGMPNRKKIGFVDYVLWGEDGKPLAVVEAKRTTYDAHKGQQQAKLYGDCLEKQYGQRPLLFYTNGYDIYLWDDTQYPERKVNGLYTRNELQRLIDRRSGRLSIVNTPINKGVAGRYYQEAALKSIAKTFETDHQRKALLVMATGTGKTRTSIALVDMMMKQGWVKNILFLADRNALVTQAKKEFGKHLPKVSPSILSSGMSKADLKSRMYFSTYPTMMNILSAPAESRLFSVGHFDLVIVDEAHRSIYRKYKYIFEYFDSFLVGLTATPKSDIDKNTYDIFELESGDPTYAYELDEGVADGYLTPPKAYSVPLKFMREGIKKFKDLTEEEQEQWDEKEALDDREEVLPSELNKFLYNKDTVDKMLKLLMEQGIHVGGGDILGKTIIFAANNDHARFIQERFDINYPKWKGHFSRVITYKEDYAETLIDEFKATEVPRGKMPLNIAVSVDMLDTGIDVPEVVNLVFFKVVRSKSKFMQMFGPNLTSENEGDKKYFKVFDYCQNFEFFEQNPEGAPDNAAKPLSQLIFEKRLELAQGLSKSESDSDISVQKYLFDLLHHQVAGMSVDNFIVRPQRQTVEKYLERETWQTLNDDQHSEIVAKLAYLPSEAEAINDDEADGELAKRFDHLMLQMELGLVQTGQVPENLRLQVVETAGQLEAKSSIPRVGEYLTLLQDMQTPEFWQDIPLVTLEDVRRKLRNLMEFLDKKQKEIVYTNFEDEEGTVTEVEMPALGIGLEQYRKRVSQYVRENENQMTIARLKRGKAITEQDLEQLDRLLFEASGMDDREHYDQVVHPDKSLGVFVRELVGLDQQAAKEAFAEFLDTGSYNAEQITFVNTVIEWFCHNGTLTPKKLNEAPFTDQHTDGVFGFFKQDKILSLVTKIQALNKSAEPKQATG